MQTLGPLERRTGLQEPGATPASVRCSGGTSCSLPHPVAAQETGPPGPRGSSRTVGAVVAQSSVAWPGGRPGLS